MKKILIVILLFMFQLSLISNVNATEITPIDGTDEFTLYGDWNEEYVYNIPDQPVQGNLYYGTYSGWVGIYSNYDIYTNRIYYALMSQVRMQPGPYVYDHRFFNKEALIKTNTKNTTAVKSVFYTPRPYISAVTETFSKTFQGNIQLVSEGLVPSFGFSISHQQAYTFDEITPTVRSLSGTSNPIHLETKFGFSNYTSKTSANRSLMVFNQMHMYYINKTVHTNSVVFKFTGEIGVTFHRVGFWNSASMTNSKIWESNDIVG